MPTLGPQPGDDITPEEFKPDAPRPSKLPRWLARLLRSEVQPGVITDRGGTRFFGLNWFKRF